MKFTIDSLQQFKCVVFDLDDTLYAERNYLFGAYEAISQVCFERYGLNKHQVFDYLKLCFETEGRERLFDKLVQDFKLPNLQDTFLQILREYHPNTPLPLFDQAKVILDFLIERKIPICILTNGNLVQQQNKVNNIAWGNRLAVIKVYFAIQYLPKPAPNGLWQIMEDFQHKPNDLVFIGDSAVDLACANNANVLFINVKDFI